MKHQITRDVREIGCPCHTRYVGIVRGAGKVIDETEPYDSVVEAWKRAGELRDTLQSQALNKEGSATDKLPESEERDFPCLENMWRG